MAVRDRSSEQNNDSSGYEVGNDSEESDLDQEWLSSFLLRWVLSEQYLALERIHSFPEEHALEVLIKHDIPTLLSELARSRPDLVFRAIT